MTRSSWLLPLVSVCFALAACSSSSGSGDDERAGGNALSAKQGFASAVNDATRQWGAVAAPQFMSEVISPTANAPAISAFNQTNITANLCDHLARFKEQTQDLDDASDLETEALEFAEHSAVDSAAVRLLEHALAAEPSERDRLLNALLVGPVYANDPKYQVNGMEVLQQGQVLDPAGKLVVPPTDYLKGRDPEGPYERYRNWFTKQPGLVFSAGTLASGIRDGLRDCAGRD